MIMAMKVGFEGSIEVVDEALQQEEMAVPVTVRRRRRHPFFIREREMLMEGLSFDLTPLKLAPKESPERVLSGLRGVHRRRALRRLVLSFKKQS
ncbi:hypothetical protein AMTR_s00048p00072160 [Amborella trichopoda]|uniref:Uncharacterized protein n=1 Tax=Amborella trichopoda TaxID=13333 RepID=U5D295_AMBTC|nr:hypothetical protein AMTR_s00048p00072160 [Amborella trichopoda]